MAMENLDPRWLDLKAKLKKIAEDLELAKRAHETAASDPAKRDAADADLTTAIDDAISSINKVVNTPPGTFPAING